MTCTDIVKPRQGMINVKFRIMVTKEWDWSEGAHRASMAMPVS